MQINEINISKGEFAFVDDLGFSDGIRLSKLGKTVVLAGPNGSGKSRLMRAISQVNAHRNQAAKEIAGRISHLTEVIASNRAALSTANEITQKAMSHNISNWESEIASLRANQQAWRAVISDPSDAILAITEFTPKNTLASAEARPPDSVRIEAGQFSNLGLLEAHVRAPAYIKLVLQKGFNAGHADFNGAGNEAVVKAAEDLKKIIGSILGDGANAHYTIDGQISIFGRTDYHLALSEGQKVLLQMAAALHAQGTVLSEAILFLDEPENHLHPAALIEVVTRLKVALTAGQIWIATHSVPLIAQLAYDEPDCLWYVSDSCVSHSGRKPERVLNGLLGGEQGVMRLNQFTQLPMQFAANRFLAQCLDTPSTVGPDAADPQTGQIRKMIAELAAKTSPRAIRVLDFGAGKGRLLAALRELDETRRPPNAIDYIAYDAFDADRAACEEEILLTYPGSNPRERYFTQYADLKARIDRNSVDLVVMCNVLHEIDPENWLREFAKRSCIESLLREDGFVLVVEDYGMPVGEMAHDHGFLLLNEPELACLFNISELDRKEGRMIAEDARPDSQPGRLKAILIAADLLARVSDESRVNAIKSLRDTSEESMIHLRKRGQSYKDGLSYALSAQLYANATIWLRSRQA